MDRGFVQLVDHMGDDTAIVQAARVSYGDGTKTVQTDENLIRYLMRHSHTTPFEMVDFKFHIRVPIHVFRQWIRHRTASVNEYSTRYSKAIDAMEETPPDQWRVQSSTNKQGSEGFIPIELGEKLSQEQRDLHEYIRNHYDYLLSNNVTREQARNDLLLSNFTEAYWKINLHNLFHFLKLRLHPHAQKEIREYAEEILRLITPIVPIAVEAFKCYSLGVVQLTTLDQEVIRSIPKFPVSKEDFLKYQHPNWVGVKKSRERDECWEKLKLLQLTER